MSRPDLVIGFACSWWTPRETTWSYSAPRLRAALGDVVTVNDIETQRALPVRAAEVAVFRALRQPWQYSRVERAMVDRRARLGVRRSRPDAVIAIADVDTPLPVPSFHYQDLSYALGLASRAVAGEYVNLLPAAPSRLAELADRHVARMKGAAGYFAMSQWLADDAVERGVPADNIRVMHAGRNVALTAVRAPDAPIEGRVLFVGGAWRRKGGDAVLAACELLRARGDDVRLTVVGPTDWPMPAPPPDWVDFRGVVPAAEVGALMAAHDVLTMPSRFEAYGIALIDAQAVGLPCIAHNAFAMPELVQHGRTGLLVDQVDPEQIADALSRILEDPSYHQRVAEARKDLLERHDWRGIARRMVNRVGEVLGT